MFFGRRMRIRRVNALLAMSKQPLILAFCLFLLLIHQVTVFDVAF